MIWYFWAMAIASTAALPVELRPLEGPPIKGNLVSLSSTQAVLTTSEGERPYPLAAVLSLAPSPAEESANVAVRGKESGRVLLADGSELEVASFRGVKGIAEIKSHQGDVTRMPLADVRYFCTNKLEGELATRWDTIVGKIASNDVLVIRKSGKNGQLLLDYLEGTVREISDEAVQFEREEKVASVPRAKVQGVVFVSAQRGEEPPPLCRVVERGGSQWNVKSLSLSKEVLQLESIGGVKIELPFDRLAKLDFSAGKILFLSDLNPELAAQPEPVIPVIRASDQAMKLLYEPKRDRFFFGGADLRLAGGTSVTKGIALTSRTELVYRMPSKFRRFQSLVGMQERYGGGEVKLRITGDQGSLYEGVVNAVLGAVPLDIEIAGTRRLRIAVEYGADGNNFGDYLILGDARVVK